MLHFQNGLHIGMVNLRWLALLLRNVETCAAILYLPGGDDLINQIDTIWWSTCKSANGRITTKAAKKSMNCLALRRAILRSTR